MATQSRTSLYERYAAGAAENYERHFVPVIGEPIARRLIDVACPAPGERVLDIACGTGIATRLAAQAVGSSESVTGLDVSLDMLEVARVVAPDNIAWHEAPAEEVPLPDASVDLVLCSMGLQFFARKERAVREMHRVIAPGGRAVWCTPGPTPPIFQAIDQALVNHLGPGASMFVQTVFSLHDPAEARSLMEGAGFVRVTVDKMMVPLHVDLPREFFWQYVRSTPLAAPAADLSEPERVALESEVVERCEQFVKHGRSILEPDLIITTAYRANQ